MSDTSVHSETRKRRYALQGTTWQKQDLTWKLMNDNNDGLTRKQVEDVMKRAFDKWQRVTNLNFRKLTAESKEKVDIEVKFVTRNHGDGYDFDGPKGTLAHAFYPHSNEGLSGDVHFDDDEFFTIGGTKGYDLLWIAVHEIGHSIGLGHSENRAAVMFPWYNPAAGQDFELHSDDKLGVQNLYGSRPTHPEKSTPTYPEKSTPFPKIQSTEKTVSPKTLPNGCTSTFKSVFLDRHTKETYVINNDNIYVLTKSNLQIRKGPIRVQTIFPHIHSVDASYTNERGNVVLFSGDKYYEYSNPREANLLRSDSIHKKFRGLPNTVRKIDAVFIWPGNGKTYLFTGVYYYRFHYGTQTIDRGYPRRIEDAWKGVPGNIDAVFAWRNKMTYFFKDNVYYRFNNKKVAVDNGYPRPISPVWTGDCGNGKLHSERTNSSTNHVSSVVMTTFIMLIVKLLHFV